MSALTNDEWFLIIQGMPDILGRDHIIISENCGDKTNVVLPILRNHSHN